METTKQIESYTNKCYLQEPPIAEGDITNIEITHKNFDVNLINKGFLNVDLKVTFMTITGVLYKYIKYKNGTPYEKAVDNFTIEDYYNDKELPEYYKDITFGELLPVYFLGWKSSAECIQQMEVLNRKQTTGYVHCNQDRDSYLENMKYTTKTEKENMRYCYTSYNNLINYEPEFIAGTYIDIEDYKNNMYDEDTETQSFEHHLEYPYTITPLNTHAVNVLKNILDKWITAGEIDADEIEENVEFTFDDANILYEIIYYRNSIHPNKGWNDNEIYFNTDMRYREFEVEDKDGNKIKKKAYYVKRYDKPNEIAEANENQYTMKQALDMRPDEIFAEYENPGPQEFKFIHDRQYGIAPNTNYIKDIHLVIPIKQLSAFRNFAEFDKAMGDITLQLKFTPRSMIYDVVKFHQYGESPDGRAGTHDCQKADHLGFTQVGTQLFMEDKEKKLSYFDTLFTTQLVVTKLEADVFGYKTTNEEKQMINSIRAQNPIIYKTHQTDFMAFNTSLEAGVLDSEITQPLRLVRDIHVVFPCFNIENTVFRNPCLRNLNLLIDGVLYPRNTPWTTDEFRFIQAQIGDFDADDDYKTSYYDAQILNHEFESNKNIDNLKEHDNTNFIATWHIGYDDFDGLDTGTANINIRIHGEIYKQYENDLIYTDKHFTPAPPQIWFTMDTYWTADVDNGLVYHKYRKP